MKQRIRGESIVFSPWEHTLGEIMKRSSDYSSRIPVLMEELKNKTLSEAERERGIGRLDYTGAGYGYNLKSHWPKNIKEAKRDAGTPELKWLERMIGAMG